MAEQILGFLERAGGAIFKSAGETANAVRPAQEGRGAGDADHEELRRSHSGRHFGRAELEQPVAMTDFGIGKDGGRDVTGHAKTLGEAG